ncbi:flagellar hook-length control protein FliK [uncultured Clostridium sp.]|uniref:flagellar hook-length control protein FliK n=1 Tax=uncultured Clostridium sp. TaxID=59620 RepID=UPI0028E7A009|nr:flagellar hook-length control protein FliK [uncultured Clostridium sp.]
MIDSIDIMLNKTTYKANDSNHKKTANKEKKDFSSILNNFSEVKKENKVNLPKKTKEALVTANSKDSQSTDTDKINPEKLKEELNLKDLDVEDLSISESLILLQYLLDTTNVDMPHEAMAEKIEGIINAVITEEFINSSDKNSKVDFILNNLLNNKELVNGELLEENKPLINELVKKVESDFKEIINLKSEEGFSDVNLVQKIKSEILDGIKNKDIVKDDESTIKSDIIKEEMPVNLANSYKMGKNNESDQFSESDDKHQGKEEKLLSSIINNKEEDKISKFINLMPNNKNSLEVSAKEFKLEEVVIGKETMVRDIVKAVKYMDTGNLKDLTVKINPKELGEVVISITMENGKMKASITANTKEAYNLINSNMNDIVNKLETSQIKIQNFTLNLYEDTTFFKGDGKGHGESQNNQGRKNSSLSAIDDSLDSDDGLGNISEDLRNVNTLA